MDGARQFLDKAADLASAGEPPPAVYWYIEPFFRLNIGLAQLGIGEFAYAAESLKTGIETIPAEQSDAEWMDEYREALAEAQERRCRRLPEQQARSEGGLMMAYTWEEREAQLLAAIERARQEADDLEADVFDDGMNAERATKVRRRQHRLERALETERRVGWFRGGEPGID